jgi:hypothetical protein
MEYSKNIKLRKARKRVEALKGFYKHLLVYSIVNIALFIVRAQVLGFFQNQSPDKNFIEWVDWNILIVPIFWGIGLLFHASKVFQYKFPFIKDWEDRKLKKFINEV